MVTGKAFVIIEALDSPAGAVLVRYQVVERIEPDPEEQRLAAAPPSIPERPPGVSQDDWELIRIQLESAEAFYKSRITPQRPIYRTDDKMVVCQKSEEITEAIREARESYDEIKKLKKAGARFEVTVGGFRAI